MKRDDLQEIEQKKFNALSQKYRLFIQDLKSKWLVENRTRSRGLGFGNDCYETMSPNQRKDVDNKIKQWGIYITPLAEAWWKERGYGVIWPDDDKENMKLYKLETIESEC